MTILTSVWQNNTIRITNMAHKNSIYEITLLRFGILHYTKLLSIHKNSLNAEKYLQHNKLLFGTFIIKISISRVIWYKIKILF